MSPRSKEQFEQMRQVSEEAIKQAALELFAHNGYHSTSISQIAKAANVSKGLVYNYFESKEELLRHIVLEAAAAAEGIMELVYSEEKSPDEKILEMIEGFFSMVQANLHYWKLMTSLAFQTDALSSMEDTIREKAELHLQYMTHVFAEKGATEPRLEAMFFAASLDGIAIQFMNLDDDYPVGQMRNFLMEKFCRG